MSDPILEIKHLSVRYDGIPMVKDVSFSVNPGEILAVIGESGSGKSTILKAILGLLGNEGTVENGEILYKGREITHISGEAQRNIRGRQIGMIFQNSGAALCPVRKIKDQIYEAVRAHQRISRREVFDRALELMNQMNLTDGQRILNSYPFEMSGGMNQRIGILMAMILSPGVLLADEPTSALDAAVQEQVVKEMAGMCVRHGTAVVMVTHNIELVSRIAGRIVIMHHGRVAEAGETQQIIRHPQAEYTRQLLAAAL